ncbi:GNAT family N-acetyltransferase [Streptomyces albireticuli]|uniref:GNAT family N-acetyltransferase n=1 Tax=Streptomyces albireticuli TaxID=1940 RepID=A0A2A2DBE7_9ACTN|nr:GNAT family N-acetyltransferase [Streptomyces albireticuli]MCD9145434.1 GNAT family N-acetyltransferase [Streptomyces albireticuli]MCD9165001.1 GNAT family N-acetyltransferase [Streptomyces albireticuli]MCD9195408.1 GNAT family N-acetyltransferase [Streptomyces albireticuli]PAU48699.1 GNAT family N-acetyltransferase [Streptomyces albireticuli]
MTDETRAKRSHGTPHWRRDAVELAALFTAVATADCVANTVAHGPDGPALLVASAAALLATTGFHTWWARRPAVRKPAAQEAPSQKATAPEVGTALWRMRTTVRDEPGSLAALCLALARHRVDILALQTHPLADGAVDELLLRAPETLTDAELKEAAAAGGGSATWLERADAHDLVDAPTRALTLATRTALDAAELPLALRQLFGRCTIRSTPARSPRGGGQAEPVPAEGLWEETVLRLPDPSGGTITIERPYLPFTPTEFARARALVELDARLGPRVPPRSDVLTLPEGNEITVRRAGTGDLAAAREMHDRCSATTLARRYHGPVGDADRYLRHLLSPRFGRTLAAHTSSGRLVALGHLLWDGEETEVALLVEDAWQRRGVGGELLGRLVTLAAEAGCESVYAVTQSSNTGMVAAMRALDLPLDYQVEEGTLVITARLARPRVPVLPATAPGAATAWPVSPKP